MNSFLKGFFSVFSFGMTSRSSLPYLSQYQYDSKTDSQKIQSDFNEVGMDIRKAMNSWNEEKTCR